MKYRISFDVIANNAREAIEQLGPVVRDGVFATGIEVNPFTAQEEVIVLELARTSLKDEEIYDYVAEELDVCNDALDELKAKIDKKMLTPA
jgi:riboflavin synthase alpha subunit